MQFKLSKDSKVTTTIPLQRINGTLSAIFDKLYVSEMHTRTVSQTNIIISIVPLLVVPKTSWEIKSAIFLRFLWVKFKDA